MNPLNLDQMAGRAPLDLAAERMPRDFHLLEQYCDEIEICCFLTGRLKGSQSKKDVQIHTDVLMNKARML
jgi:hypothetical protein